jgi:hypothetical protein
VIFELENCWVFSRLHKNTVPHDILENACWTVLSYSSFRYTPSKSVLDFATGTPFAPAKTLTSSMNLLNK